MNGFWRIAVSWVTLYGCSSCWAAETGTEFKPPNVVLILVDDLGWADLGCYGHAYHRTPNIDAIARSGMLFTNGYAPAPICSASRASILTGKTPARLNFEFVTKNNAGHQQLDVAVPLQTPKFTLNLPVSEVTIADRLSELGYSTAFFGKWHVSQHYQGRYLAWHPKYGPLAQGFQIATENFGDHPYAWQKGTRPADLEHGKFPDDAMVQLVRESIQNLSQHDSPYFVMASSFYVHTPIKNRARWLVESYEHLIPAEAANRKKRLEYAAFVETLDHHVGNIVKEVRDSPEADNTLIFFMSDNGGHPEFSSNAPLRGSKWNLYEGGIRVPMIAVWPKVIDAGKRSDTPVIGYDLFATFESIAGGNRANKGEFASDIDGLDISPVFVQADWNPNRTLVWHFPYYHPERTYSQAIETIGIGDFKVSKTRPQSAIRDGQYKLLHFAESDRVELYHLAGDVSEQDDLSTRRPKLAQGMLDALNRRLESMGARRAIVRH